MLLITGASGLLGANLLLNVAGEQPVTGVYHTHRVRAPVGAAAVQVDLTDPVAVRELLLGLEPAYVVHCAALTDVDHCDQDPALAHRTNVLATRHVAEAARAVSAGLAFISTDAVFGGQDGPHCEDDVPAPVNVYGQTKLDAERAALAAHPGTLVVRTNIYGWSPHREATRPNLAEWLVGRLEAGEPVRGFTDVSFTPILVNDLVDALLVLIRRCLSGVYHVAGGEAASKYTFARLLAEVFRFDPDCVRPGSVAHAALRAPRAADMTLATDKAASVLGRPLPGLRAGLERFRVLRDQGYVEELRALVA